MSGTQDQNENQSGTENENTANEGNNPSSGSQGQQPNGGNEDDSLFSDPVKAKELVKNLRSENAKHRTRSKELESKLSSMDGTLGKLKQALGIGDGEEQSPEEQVQTLNEQLAAYQSEVAIRDLAAEYEVPHQSMKFFRFLMSEKFNELEEGDELSEEDLNEIIAEAKKGNAGKAGVNGTGVNAKGNNPNPDAQSGLSVASFAKMTVGEKSLLYQQDPTTYNKLFAEAKDKNLI